MMALLAWIGLGVLTVLMIGIGLLVIGLAMDLVQSWRKGQQ